ncbi:MAG: DUF2442 domain-containing protein [Chloroflexi bacterium]|nr:DUF2442 domain-containing protein [Chloroflexota bacterium]
MPTKAEVPKKTRKAQVRRYAIQAPIAEYTYPSDARIQEAWVDEAYIHVRLMDGRILSIPLAWVPTVHQAAAEARGRFTISRDRTMLIWDPERSGINDELRIADYLVPGPQIPPRPEAS